MISCVCSWDMCRNFKYSKNRIAIGHAFNWSISAFVSLSCGLWSWVSWIQSGCISCYVNENEPFANWFLTNNHIIHFFTMMKSSKIIKNPSKQTGIEQAQNWLSKEESQSRTEQNEKTIRMPSGMKQQRDVWCASWVPTGAVQRIQIHFRKIQNRMIYIYFFDACCSTSIYPLLLPFGIEHLRSALYGFSVLHDFSLESFLFFSCVCIVSGCTIHIHIWAILWTYEIWQEIAKRTTA